MKIGLVIVLNPTPRTAPLLYAGRLEEGLAAAAAPGLRRRGAEHPGPRRGGRRRLWPTSCAATAWASAPWPPARPSASTASAWPAPTPTCAAGPPQRLQAHACLASLLGSAVTVGLIRGMLAGDEAEQSEGRKRIPEGVAAFASFAGAAGRAASTWSR